MAPPAKSILKPVAPEPVLVRLPITLGQFLKVANLASSGGEAKALIADGSVRVNGQSEQRRGRKLVPGDVVQVAGRAARVSSADAGAAGTDPGSSPEARTNDAL